MREMCMNLAINAVQASSRGGRVTATTQSAADHVTIVIADTGAGISPSTWRGSGIPSSPPSRWDGAPGSG